MNLSAKWIYSEMLSGDGAAPVFRKSFDLKSCPEKAVLHITALGVYHAEVNGRPVGRFVLAPGWTAYQKRLQVQEYDITELLTQHNTMEVIVGRGWYHTMMPGFTITEDTAAEMQDDYRSRPLGLIAEISITYQDGTCEIITSDGTWNAAFSRVRFSDLYGGEVYDAAFTPGPWVPAKVFEGPSETLIPQEGPEILEQETICPVARLITPEGDVIVDFGQNLTGYVEISVDAACGDEVDLSFGEVLDRNGNFYNANYRGAKCLCRYICRDGKQTYKPLTAFYGFRYIRINRFPGGPEKAECRHFRAIEVHSEMTRTGTVSSSSPLLNQLLSNIVWSQRDNFLDVPTDCPQRGERLGWTGDAQIYAKAACLNFDTERFFSKWLNDLKAEQGEDGYVGFVVPDVLHSRTASAAWGDAAVIVPWELYLAYGDREILCRQYESMRKWISYIRSVTDHPYLWTGGEHFGDWGGLDSVPGGFKGATREDFIASAYYAWSTSLVIKAGRILGHDTEEYEKLYENILKEFRKAFPVCLTQTECVLAAHFSLWENPQDAADQLVGMLEANDWKLQTGFVGTPYLLHVLGDYGYPEVAYRLLLREEYPSWLYAVKKGATTVWEHWDGIREDGSFWDTRMNSFNHYVYGSVIDWVYTFAAGIRTAEDHPGYEKVIVAPHPDEQLDWLEAELKTRHGTIRSGWRKQEASWRFDIETPVDAEIIIHGAAHSVKAGGYCFYSDRGSRDTG